MSKHSDEELSRLRDALGGSVRLQSKAVEQLNKARRYFWISDLRTFHDQEVPENEVCRHLFAVRDLINYVDYDVCLQVNVEFSANEDIAGFYIPSSIIVAAAAVGASIDVPIDYLDYSRPNE